MEIFGLILGFVLFLIVLTKGYLATLNPLSLIIVIALSLIVGYALAALISLVFTSALKVVIVLIVIGLIISFLK